jgi:hypothetical protein
MRHLVRIACVVAFLFPPRGGADEPAKLRADRLTTAQATALVREVSATVEQLRHLRFKTPVAVEVVDGSTARKDFEAGIDDAERERARHTRDAWAHLGLVPAAMDLVDARLDTAENDVLGYYQAGSKTFRVLSHVPDLELRSVMAHELTHALEDQYYDLEALEKRATNEDHAVAIRAVVEGSAMVTTLAILAREGGIGKAKEEAEKTTQVRAKSVKGRPTFVRMRLLVPYTLGFSFLLRGKPWEWLYDGVRIEDIDYAYAHPPHSTTEILHPDQYWGGHRADARSISLPDLSQVLGPGWSLAATGSIGELGLTMLTGSQVNTESYEALLPTRWITAGAWGTAGDTYHHYVDGDRKVTVLLTRWESMQDADEFQRTLRGASKTQFRVGASLVVLMGDFGDKGQALAIEATRGLPYWTGR